MTAAVDFEALYRRHPDPWGYTDSAYERDKYAATLEACGPGPFARALELGGSIGVFSELLAPRCQSLTTIDGAPTAVAQAERRLARSPNVEVLLGDDPAGHPPGTLRPRGGLRDPLLPVARAARADARRARRHAGRRAAGSSPCTGARPGRSGR